MVRKIALLICVIIFFSCEKEESVDLLTDGTWALVDESSPTTNETIKFNSDGTFVLEVVLKDNYLPGITTPVFSTYVRTGKLSGDWSLKDNDIQFSNPIVSISKNDSILESTPTLENGHYVINIQPGQPIGSLFGYGYLEVYQNDSTTINSPIYGPNKLIIGNDTVDVVYSEDGVPPRRESSQWTWTIVKLTEDSLVINLNGTIKRYTKK